MSGGEGTGRARALCAGCGCLCDDLSLDDPPYRRGRPHVETECRLGRDWFASRIFGGALEARPPTVEGEEVDLARAVAEAGRLLRGARRPLLTGLERLPLTGQRRMVELADRVGADLVDLEASDDRGASRLAIHRDGGPFVTLAEIRERVDCLVLWYVRPERSHPRFLERFWPARDDGRERTLVAVGPGAGESGADVAVSVAPERSLRLLWLLRLLAEDPSAPERREDPLAPRAVGLLERMRGATAGAWLYDGGAGGVHRPGPVETSGILRLLGRLNGEAPWGARPLGGGPNPAGAEAVATWQTGYPTPLTFRGGAPRYDGTAPGGDREDVDAVLLVGGRPDTLPLPHRPSCVWLDTGEPAGGGDASDGPAAAVRIPVLPAGAAAGDTLLRMDGLPVRSPGIPGAGDGGRVLAAGALEGVLEALAADGRGSAGP